MLLSFIVDLLVGFLVFRGGNNKQRPYIVIGLTVLILGLAAVSIVTNSSR